MVYILCVADRKISVYYRGQGHCNWSLKYTGTGSVGKSLNNLIFMHKNNNMGIEYCAKTLMAY